MKKLNVFVIGSGRAAQAIQESFRILELGNPEFFVEAFHKVPRGSPLRDLNLNVSSPILVIAGPHGLHANAILAADPLGFELIVCEKPAAVSLAEIASLKSVKTPVAVCHGYRQSWGLQTLRTQIAAGEFGRLIAIEGRYWQSSAAQNAQTKNYQNIKTNSWKNDPAFGGTHDVLLDIASHWADAAIFLAGEPPADTQKWLSHVNAETTHRDTHVQLVMNFKTGVRGFASISKTVHGASNHFEVNVIGQKKSATWNFLSPDVIVEGHGNETLTRTRTSQEAFGSGHAPHHGLGWIEGYVKIIQRALFERGAGTQSYPTLAQHLRVLEVLLQA